MERVANLMQTYRATLEAAAVAAPPSERNLCSLLLQELSNVEHGISADDPAIIRSSLSSQQQLFGRSFLSGSTGQQAERAFNQVLRQWSDGT